MPIQACIDIAGYPDVMPTRIRFATKDVHETFPIAPHAYQGDA